MADNFGLKIGIEGEKEFKKALSEINQSFKVLGSEMKLVSSQFDKNDKSVQALSARNTVLNKEIEAQKNKVETLRAALQNAADSFGENDRRTQNWQIQLNNAEAALNGMERELSDNERAIEALSQEETDAADATERLSREIAQQEDALAGMKRAYSNAVLQYGKGSSEAKELEGRISQLSGELRENRERMKDAGDVAEDLGDSLEDASEGADKLGSGLSVATVAMGNLISSGIQAALNGIKELGSAIWNLDEATEEYRVAQGKLTTAFEAAGYSGDAAQKSYTEFYKILGDTDTATEASQLLAQLAQNEQDITKWTNIAAGVYGTFGDALPIEGMIESANETAKVGQVTGSLADALNWVGISEDEFNEKLAACSDESERNRLIMEILSGAYDEASGAFYRNNEALVASREGQAQLDETLAGLGETISNVKNSLRAEFLPAISEVISAFTDMINGVDGADEAFAGAITGLVNTAVSMLPQFVDTGMQMLTSLLSGIIQSLPAVVEGAAQIIVTLAQGIAEAVPTLIPQIVLVVTQIVQTLIENLPMILDAALQLILGLAQGLLDAIPVLVAALPAIITALVEFIVGAIPQIIDAGIQLLTSLISALPEIITAIVAAIPQIIDGLVTAILGSIPQIIDAGVNLLISLIQNLPTIITTIVGAIPQIITSIINALVGNIDKIILAGVQLFVALITNLPKIIVEIVKAVPQIISAIVKGFAGGVSQMANIGLNLIKGIWNGIGNAASWLWNKVSGFCSNLLSKIKGFFGISSPSREMAWVGDMLTQGLAGGIEDGADAAISAAEDLNNGILGVMNGLAADMQSAVPSNFAFDASGTVGSVSGGMGGAGGSSFGTLITIQQMIVRSEDDIRRISQELYNLIQTGSRAQGRFSTA
uniref:Tail tape measure protein n=1 Tax=Siphoviridae sp. ctTBd21 TaxID=2825516 RepID=A0A8S5Q8F7_9CAUD|nr:MAG TPA: tail tape measure protein [Siphoviridae sp. ctTBd21]